MRSKEKIPFTRLSSNFEIVKAEDLFSLKGGGESDDWQGSPGSKEDPLELEEVVITAEKEPDEPDPLPEPDPIDTNPDPEDPDFEFPPDDAGGSTQDEPEEEKECTCELKNQPAADAPSDVKDGSNLLQNLKDRLSGNEKVYNDLLKSGTYPPGITKESVTAALSTISDARSMIKTMEDSNRGFRIESGGVDGETTKDTKTGEYVLRVGQSSNGYSNDALLLHEIVHANQILKGEVGFDATGHATMVGMEDEVAAYKLSLGFESGALPQPTVDAAYVKSKFPGTYDNLPANGSKCPVHG